MPSGHRNDPNGKEDAEERRPTEEHSLLEMQGGPSHSERDRRDDLLRKRRRKRLLATFSIVFVVCLVSFMSIAAVRAIFFSEPPIPVDVATQIASLNSRKTTVPVGCESEVILMRHCEKVGEGHVDGDGDQHCSEIGYKRAEYIATLFGNETSSGRWPTPVKLYAMGHRRPFVRHSNYREIETLTPLATKSHSKVDARFTAERERDLAEDYFDSLVDAEKTGYCGGVTVVNWKHSRMHLMAVALGCGPEQGCPVRYKGKEFDKVWVIRYRYHGEEPTGEDDGADGGRRTSKKHKRIVYGWTVKGKVSKEHFVAEGTNSTDAK